MWRTISPSSHHHRQVLHFEEFGTFWQRAGFLVRRQSKSLEREFFPWGHLFMEVGSLTLFRAIDHLIS
jgi:hypothetical protein